MDEMNGYRGTARILRRVRRSEERPTPERLEENLRWLMLATMPPARASETLRLRVRAIADAHREWLASQQAGREGLRAWQGLECALTGSEREALALLLTADLQLLAEDPVLCEEARRVMRRLLEVLPEPLREALLLQVIQDLSIAEISHVLGCPEGETAVLLHQARMSIFRQADSVPRGAD
jgi:DNA-directed RNA polymerase specialized sigma24 family protein